MKWLSKGWNLVLKTGAPPAFLIVSQMMGTQCPYYLEYTPLVVACPTNYRTTPAFICDILAFKNLIKTFFLVLR